MHSLIESHREAIADLCRLHGVRKLDVFGSAIRDDFDPQRSDVDVLVEFEPRVSASFSNLVALKTALERLLGCPVDVLELHAIRNRRLRYYIEKSKAPIYTAE